ncbi:MAG: sodium:proton antiporter [Bacteroidales bacterium]|nr:sodium:proton antiporter [Bacteroidales bacterium]MBN2762942.1 sodium:proton antiporter [Bacteroidales bacterium]
MVGEYSLMISLVIALFAGVIVLVITSHLRMPAIVFLLATGIALGPYGLDILDPSILGKGFDVIISLLVAIILFDGGLTLQFYGYKRTPAVIRKLLTIGVLITWFGTAIAVRLLFGFSYTFSLLAGSVIIVTGPTVIKPILQRIKVKENIQNILQWESVLIDPLGVFIAIFCFDLFLVEEFMLKHIFLFFYRLAVGIVIGLAGGHGIAWLIEKRKVIPEEQTNIFVFSAVLLIFGLSELLISNSGILTVIVAGLVLGIKKTNRLRKIKQFKSEISELSLAILFILLAANLNLDNFLIVGAKGLILVAIVLYVIRPVNVAISARRTKLTFREGVLLSWIAPRGVVAASMASLFTLQLKDHGIENAFLETFSFTVIIVSVVIHGSTAGFMARLLRLKETRQKLWLIVSSNMFSRALGEFIKDVTGQKCIFVDTNADAIEEARAAGFEGINMSALQVDTFPTDVISNVENVIALTDNHELNIRICEKWSKYVKDSRLYRWTSAMKKPEDKTNQPGIPVWKGMVGPSKIAYALRHGEVSLARKSLRNLTQELKDGQMVLTCIMENQVLFKQTPDLQDRKGEALILQGDLDLDQRS